MSRERRQSAASSGLSDVSSCLPTITEDEISGMSLEQLEVAAEELHNLCSTLQAEVDLYTRYLSSQVVPEHLQATTALTPASLSGSGTATPTLSSLDVRGLWHGQVITRGRTQNRIKLSEKEKYRLWQRELEIVLANRRKQEKVWKQQLHKCQVSTLQAETQRASVIRGQQELLRVATGYDHGHLEHCSVRITFQQLRRFMEEQIRKGLKEVSQVWVQVSLSRGELTKLKSKLEGRDGILDLDVDAGAISQVTYLKKRLEHEEVKTRLENNSKQLGQLTQKLETERRKAIGLEDENQKAKSHLEEVRSLSTVLQEELRRLSDASLRIESHIKHEETKTQGKVEALKKKKGGQVMSVKEYLKLNSDVEKLGQEVRRWKHKVDSLPFS